MRKRRITRYVALGSCLLSTSSCSFVFVHGPPRGYEQMDSFSCTESRIVPVLDVVGVGASVVNAATAEDERGLFGEDGSWFAPSREAQIASHVVVGVVLAASAVTGFRRVDRCRAALDAFFPGRIRLIQNWASTLEERTP